jgi:exodeoxyribonuclease VII small subunit
MSDSAKQPGRSQPSPAPGEGEVLSISFDEAQAELETLIERIETGQLGLEEAVKAYEHGVRLVKHCRGILSRTEQRFADLSAEMRETN